MSSSIASVGLLNLLFDQILEQHDLPFEILLPFKQQVPSREHRISNQNLAWLVSEASHLECLLDEVDLPAARYAIVVELHRWLLWFLGFLLCVLDIVLSLSFFVKQVHNTCFFLLFPTISRS